METFAQRLTRLREDVGIGRRSLALMAGVSEQEIAGFEEGYSEPRIGLLLRFAQIFGVSAAYISMLTDERTVCEDSGLYETLILSTPQGTATRRDVVGVSFVSKESLHGQDAVGRVMTGDSMEETISEGDRIIFRVQHSSKNGNIVAAKTERGELIGRYERKGNVVILKPENPLFEAVTINTDTENFEIIGVATEIHKDL